MILALLSPDDRHIVTVDVIHMMMMSMNDCDDDDDDGDCMRMR